MPRGAAIIRYEGVRGVTWKIKFRDADGRQVKRTIGREADGVTRKDAEAAARAAVVNVERKGWRKPPPLTFKQAADDWFAEQQAEKGWKPATVGQYVSIRGRLDAAFGHRRLADLRPSDVAAYKQQMLRKGYSAASISRDMSILHSLLAWAVVTERIDRNVATGVPHPRPAQRKGTALTPQEVQALARAFTEEQDRLVFLTLVLTGVRRAELQALRWRDVDLIENRVRVVDSKTELGSRSIAIPPMLAERLWQHRRTTAYAAEADRVFVHPERGSMYGYETFSAALRAAYAAAGLEYPEGMRPFHDLRVTSITNDAIAGANPVALMTKAGHANMATTRRYLRLAGVVFAEEAEALERRLLGGLVPNPGTEEPQTALHSGSS
jgi:integrase